MARYEIALVFEPRYEIALRFEPTALEVKGKCANHFATEAQKVSI
jgi:hypothetical protein